MVWAAFWSVKAGMLWLVGFDKRSIAPVIDTFGPGRHKFVTFFKIRGFDVELTSGPLQTGNKHGFGLDGRFVGRDSRALLAVPVPDWLTIDLPAPSRTCS